MADPGRIDLVMVELRPGVFSRQVGKSHTRQLSQILDGNTVADCRDNSRSLSLSRHVHEREVPMCGRSTDSVVLVVLLGIHKLQQTG